jgi:hypothetical protein
LVSTEHSLLFCREKKSVDYIAKLHRIGLLNDEEKEWWDKFWKEQEETEWEATGGRAAKWRFLKLNL